MAFLHGFGQETQALRTGTKIDPPLPPSIERQLTQSSDDMIEGLEEGLRLLPQSRSGPSPFRLRLHGLGKAAKVLGPVGAFASLFTVPAMAEENPTAMLVYQMKRGAVSK